MKKASYFSVFLLVSSLTTPLLFAQKGPDYKDDILKKINGIRLMHGAPALKWNDALASAAQAKAEASAQANVTQIAPDESRGSIGNAIFKMVVSAKGQMPGGKLAVSAIYENIDYWYKTNPAINYNYAKPVFPTDQPNLRLVQLLWKGSTEMGFGIAVGANYVYFYALFNAKANPNELLANVSGPQDIKTDTKNEYSAVIQDILKLHNEYRAKHNAPPLTLSPKISGVAQEWADLKAKEGNMTHRMPNSYSENIFNHNVLSANLAVNAWYGEIKYYDFNNPGGNLENAGHFTALVWQNSREVGVGIAKSKDGFYYYVVNYSPRGNIVGTFNRNVVAVGKKPITGNLDYTKGIDVKSSPESMKKTQVFGLKDCSSTNAVRKVFDNNKKPYIFRDVADPANESLLNKLLEEAYNDDKAKHPYPMVIIKQKLYMANGLYVLPAKPLLPLMP